ncbi:hypothetical protein [Phreatobacter stygius]|uniref:PetM family of cytochrome b6f complex subunit 7 n=1 Tax=Phreatobacter stygius TaxID=1940610 RepID=A0A4D7BAU5_9HYPH|nr:hypothetical protein [Phreatobacter stygius]QCI65232.1 hypothetical protein E8M01_14045 [Phreatobacter stygius]
MIRFVLRLVGFILVALGFIALVIDGTKSIAGGRLIYTVIGETWRTLHSDSLQAVQPALEKAGLAWLWDPVMLTVLILPTALAGLGLGALLMIAGRKYEPQIGVIGRR